MSGERVRREAIRVASELTVRRRGGRARPLRPRVRDNGRVLLRCYVNLAHAVRDRGSVPPAAEWLVDNFHVVENALQLVWSDLPRGFYRRLPKLESGPFEGYPRVLALMDALASLVDSRFALEGEHRRGGMGTVWKARDLLTQRRAAVTILDLGAAEHDVPEHVDLFRLGRELGV